MNTWLSMSGIVAVLIVVLGVFAAIQTKKQKEIMARNPGYPKGYWKSRGIAIGLPIGMGIGVAMQNIAVGVAIGVALGVAIGQRNEKQHRDEIREPTEEELALKKQSAIIMFITLSIGMLVFAGVYFYIRR